MSGTKIAVRDVRGIEFTRSVEEDIQSAEVERWIKEKGDELQDAESYRDYPLQYKVTIARDEFESVDEYYVEGCRLSLALRALSEIVESGVENETDVFKISLERLFDSVSGAPTE